MKQYNYLSQDNQGKVLSCLGLDDDNKNMSPERLTAFPTVDKELLSPTGQLLSHYLSLSPGATYPHLQAGHSRGAPEPWRHTAQLLRSNYFEYHPQGD